MDQQKQKQLKVFGYGMPILLIFLGARHGLKHSWDTLSYGLFLAAALFLAMALWNKPLLLKVFGYWMKAAHFIGTIVTGAILIFLYYVVFTPVSLVLKLMKKDFMDCQWKKETFSYWTNRKTADVKDSQQYIKQF